MGSGVSILIALGSLVMIAGIGGVAVWMVARSGDRTRANMYRRDSALKRVNGSGQRRGSSGSSERRYRPPA
jgi:hypothetical protein